MSEASAAWKHWDEAQRLSIVKAKAATEAAQAEAVAREAYFVVLVASTEKGEMI